MQRTPRLRELRVRAALSQENLAELSDVARATIADLEAGKRPARPSTIRKLAKGLEVEVTELYGEADSPLAEAPPSPEQPPLNGFEEERRDAEPLSPKVRRETAWMRRAELDAMQRHLALRAETLREEAKESREAGDSEGVFSLFLDAALLATGAETTLAEARKEAQEIGAETKEERRLQSRLEHRIEDLEEARAKIGDLWEALMDAKSARLTEEAMETETGKGEKNTVVELFKEPRRDLKERARSA